VVWLFLKASIFLDIHRSKVAEPGAAAFCFGAPPFPA
jgi:hypothetical protein